MAARNLYPRTSRACRFALATNFDSIKYAPTLREIATNQAARDEIEKIPRRARRTLSFYAALHRTGKMGFLGAEANHEATFEAIQRTTDGPCKRSTLKGAYGELDDLGYLEKYWGTELTERDKFGNWRPHTFEIEPGVRQACRVRIYKLTRKALALWSEVPLEIVPKPPKKAAKPLSQKMATSKRTKRCFTTPVSCAGDRPPSGCLLETGDNEEIAGVAADRSNGRSSTTGGESKPQAATSPQQSDTATRHKGNNAKFGPAVERPKSPRTGASSSWSNNRARLLSALWLALASYPRREADCLYSRTVQETDRSWPARWPRCLDWDHWIRRWDRLVYSESRRLMLHTLLPALRGNGAPDTTGSAASAPAKQTRMSSARAPSVFSVGDLPDFLSGAVGKLLEKGLIDV